MYFPKLARKTILAALLVLSLQVVTGQVLLKGTVYDRTQRFALPGVSVMGTSGAGTATDSLGHYSIRLSSGDSIYFSYLGRNTAKFSIKDIPSGQEFDMSLQVTIDSLPSVYVRPKDYYRDSVENREEYRKIFDYGGPQYLDNMKTGKRGGMGVGLDFDLLFQGRQIRRMEAFQKRLEEEERDKYVDHRFTRTLVKRITGLQPPALDTFMREYRPSYEFIQSCENEYQYYKYIADWGKYFDEMWKRDHPDTAMAQQTIRQYLSGTDKDHTVSWDFFCTKGRNSGKWSTIQVPSNWEMQGFGTYNYYKDLQNPDEQGLYKHTFNIAPQHKGKRIFLVFDASMTDTEVKINGRSAGPVHQGGFYEFRYDITTLLLFDRPNLLEVTVSKHSSNASINGAERKADFWLFGGIFRPVYLEIVPPSFIERVAINASANGDFVMQVFSNIRRDQTIAAQVYELNGRTVGPPFQLPKGDSILTCHFDGIKLWNPEAPHLYYVKVFLEKGLTVIHEIRQRFGFRTAELRREDGFYVNGVKVIFKGVCRHSEWPETGRTLSREIQLLDIGLIKGMNMNAVRMSHYPPDKEFLDLCDSLGLFVLDELTGWQAAYDTVTGRRLVKELVVRDVNHPSIVLWDNGNEGGWNRALDHDYALYDPQKRHVIHPWERFDGTNTKHYPDFKYVQTEVANAKEVFFPTEFMHGLFDGGQGAALEDLWKEMMKHPHAAGGFLWSFHDEGAVRRDLHDSIDVAGNQAPDGIVGPHREKEASYYTIKELWSPVHIEAVPGAGGDNASPGSFSGKLTIENRYLYTNLRECKLEWKLVAFPNARENPADGKTSASQTLQYGVMGAPALAPGEKGVLSIPVPANSNADALYLLAYGAKGDTICTWSRALHSPEDIVRRAVMVTPVRSGAPTATTEGIDVTETTDAVSVVCDGIRYKFDKGTGLLDHVVNSKGTISLFNGPVVAGSTGAPSLEQLRHFTEGEQYIVEPAYRGDSLRVKWIFQSGKLPQLEYSYLVKDTADYMGITFDYPESSIKGMKWMGRGPYRVWKNRMKGQQFGVWEKAWNNTVTGENWDYPEFKGWHAELYWVKLQNKECDFIIYTDRPDIFLEMGQPEKPKAAGNNNTSPPFPEGYIGFMHGISAIGTKFQRPELLGPQSQRYVQPRGVRLAGALYFDFR